jgi:hypothetical protein
MLPPSFGPSVRKHVNYLFRDDNDAGGDGRDTARAERSMDARNLDTRRGR